MSASFAFEFDTEEAIETVFERLVAAWCDPSRPDRSVTVWHRTDPVRAFTSVQQEESRAAHFLLKRFEALSAQLKALVRTIDDPRIGTEGADLQSPVQEKTWQAHFDYHFYEAAERADWLAVAQVLCGVADGAVFYFRDSEGMSDFYLPAVEAPSPDVPVTMVTLADYEPDTTARGRRYVLGC